MPPKKNNRVHGQGRATDAQAYHKRARGQKEQKFLSNGDIRRLARRGGVKRMSFQVYESAKNVILSFLHQVMSDTLVYTQYAKRTIVTHRDVKFAAAKYGRSIYGFNE